MSNVLRLYLISPFCTLKVLEIVAEISIKTFKGYMCCSKFKYKHHQKLENKYSP